MTDTDGDRVVLSVELVALPEAVVVAVAGDLDLETAPVLRRQAFAALDERPLAVILDLGAVTFCGSAGLQVLSELVTATAATDLPFAVVAGHRPVLRALQLTRIDVTLSLHPELEQARGWVRGQSST
ncbi:anti-anti-sigma factor [Amycolatopsis pretoriensis]|uniref:Anti-sigma factor antagonist n=1 Tax=Amycolatopsis pretoriensis TaxID=218821 RepID=A0A1H5RJE8_9PSEU|nr:STAS domain-containing protein [Amycolatopsis pretoriensis]SEF38370.1 anti-anti-sigma factor [Amycolatopsis pretoriensis]